MIKVPRRVWCFLDISLLYLLSLLLNVCNRIVHCLSPSISFSCFFLPSVYITGKWGFTFEMSLHGILILWFLHGLLHSFLTCRAHRLSSQTSFLHSYHDFLRKLVFSIRTMSCPVLSCPVLSCPVLSCPVLSCPVLSILINCTAYSTLAPLTSFVHVQIISSCFVHNGVYDRLVIDVWEDNRHLHSSWYFGVRSSFRLVDTPWLNNNKSAIRQ
jgi:hypothetical protein